MSSTTTSIFDLSPSEKLLLVEDLWDDLATNCKDIPVHDWQKEELTKRKNRLINQPSTGISWDDMHQRIKTRYAR